MKDEEITKLLNTIEQNRRTQKINELLNLTSRMKQDLKLINEVERALKKAMKVGHNSLDQSEMAKINSYKQKYDKPHNK